MMPEQQPKSYDDLKAEVDRLTLDVASLQSSGLQLMQQLQVKQAEVDYLRRRKPPRALDPQAADRFARPAYKR